MLLSIQDTLKEFNKEVKDTDIKEVIESITSTYTRPYFDRAGTEFKNKVKKRIHHIFLDQLFFHLAYKILNYKVDFDTFKESLEFSYLIQI